MKTINIFGLEINLGFKLEIKKVKEVRLEKTKDLFTDLMETMIEKTETLYVIESNYIQDLLDYVDSYNKSPDHLKITFFSRNITCQGFYSFSWEPLTEKTSLLKVFIQEGR
jgi:hypothetical protein